MKDTKLTRQQKDKLKTQYQIHHGLVEIQQIATLLGTEDMTLAGILYLSTIVQRRKRPVSIGIEVHRADGS